MLDAARRDEHPTCAQKNRARHSLQAAVAGLALAPTAVLGSSALVGKIVVGVAVLGALGVAGLGAMIHFRGDSAQRAPVASVPGSNMRAEETAERRELIALENPEVPTAPGPLRDKGPRRIKRPMHAARPRDAAAPAPPPLGAPVSTPAPACTPADELRLLREAQETLETGAPGRALELADEHARSCTDGTLSEERGAVRILALCALGRRSEAEVELIAFRNRAPRSPHLRRLSAACEPGAGPSGTP